MNRKGNVIIREQGPVWYAKVEITSVLVEGSQIRNVKSKRWKIKEILN